MQKVHYLQSYIIIKGNSIKRMYWHSLTNHFLVWSITISFIEPILVYKKINAFTIFSRR